MGIEKLRRALLHLVRAGVLAVPLVFLLGPRAPSDLHAARQARAAEHGAAWILVDAPLALVQACDRLPHIPYPLTAWKSFAFRMLVEVLLGLWVVLVLLDRRHVPRFSWVLVAPGAFGMVIGVADLAGVDPYRSLWGNLERMQGFAGLLHLLAFTVVATGVLATARLWRAFFWVSLSVCAAVCYEALVLGRLAGPATAELRLAGRAGTPIFLAVYALLHAGLAALLACGARARRQRLLAAGLGTLCLATVVMTGTRAAWVGAIVGAGVAIASAALLGGSAVARRRAIFACAAAGIALLAGAGLAAAANPSWEGVPVLERFLSVRARAGLMVDVWRIAAQGILQRPILGWGQENFGYVFDAFYEPRLLAYGWMWSDRCHNVLLGWALAGGIAGLLAYAAVHGATLWAVWRPRRPGWSVGDRAIVIGTLAAYLVYDSVQIDDLASYLPFFALLGYVHVRAVGARQSVSTPGSPRRALLAAPLVLAAVVWGLAWANLRPIRAAVAAEAFTRHFVEVDATGSPQLVIERALRDDCFVTSEIRERLALWAPQLREMAVPAVVVDRTTALAIAEMEKEVAARPRRARTRYLAGRMLARLGDYGRAIEHLEAALALSPRRQRIEFEIAEACLVMGRLEESVARYERGLAIDHNDRAQLFYGSGHAEAAKALFSSGREQEALQLCRKLVVDAPLAVTSALKALDWMLRHEPRDPAQVEACIAEMRKLRADELPER